MIVDKNTWGDSSKSKCLDHLINLINTLDHKEQKKLCSSISRKLNLIKRFSNETKASSESLKKYIHKNLFIDIKTDINSLELSSSKVKTLAINFLVANLRSNLLNGK